MEHKKPIFIEVKPEEVALIKEAEQIEEKLIAESKTRMEAEGAPSSMVDPFLIYNTPRESEILQARDQLALKYKRERNLDKIPTLIPLASFYQKPRNVQEPDRFHSYQRDTLTTASPAELRDLLLTRVPILRRGETLFVRERGYFERMDDNEVKGLIAEKLRDELRYGNTPLLINGILTLLKSERRIIAKIIDAPDLLAVRNGAVNLEYLRLCKIAPNSFYTHFRNTEWYDVPQSCPVFQSFLEFISAGDRELYTRIWETVGFLLYPDGNTAKKFVLFQGVGNSGKSVLGSLIQSFFQSNDISSLSVHQLSGRFALSALADRSINVSMDLPNGILDGHAIAVIKQITGGDSVSIEAKNRQPYSDILHCKLLFGTNHPVELKIRDEALAKRILLIPFRVPVPENQMDHNLLDKLKQEKPAILYYAIAAYQNVIRHNYQFTGEERFGFKLKDIVLPAQPTESVSTFVTQCCQLDPEAFSTSEELHLAFLEFCRRTGLPPIEDRPLFAKALRTCLGNQITSTKRRVNRVPLNGYLGIKLV